MTRQIIPLFVLCLAALSAGPVRAGWVLSTDFSTSNGNPNGVWSYGYRSNLTSAFTTFTQTVSGGINGSVTGWQYGFNPAVSFDGNPGVYLSTSSNLEGTVYYEAGGIIQHPGQDLSLSVSRFTAPESGTFVLSSGFTQQDSTPGDTNVYVLLNGSELYSGQAGARGNPIGLSATLILTKGDTLEFAVGAGNSFWNDSTGVYVSIQSDTVATPEPASITLFGLGLLGLGAVRVRQWFGRAAAVSA